MNRPYVPELTFTTEMQRENEVKVKAGCMKILESRSFKVGNDVNGFSSSEEMSLNSVHFNYKRRKSIL